MLQFNDFKSKFPANYSYVADHYQQMSGIISRRKDWVAANDQQIQQWLAEHEPLTSCALPARPRLHHIIVVVIALIARVRPTCAPS